jgi:hypothetical protein
LWPAAVAELRRVLALQSGNAEAAEFLPRRTAAGQAAGQGRPRSLGQTHASSGRLMSPVIIPRTFGRPFQTLVRPVLLDPSFVTLDFILLLGS